MDLHNKPLERVTPGVPDQTAIEHLHRYALAMKYAEGKAVLDIACGEGYGAHLLSGSANSVTGMDIDPSIIAQAQKKYSNARLTFIEGDINRIPSENSVFDLLVCFETLEHVADHESVMSEIRRVLKPGGLLLISTPEKANYSDPSVVKNPFHVKELYGKEFQKLLNDHFSHVKYFGQKFFCGSVVIEENNKLDTCFEGDFEKIRQVDFQSHYWIALASDLPLPDLSSSLFDLGQTVSGIREEQSQKVKKTRTYQAGRVILFPFKLLRAFFRK